MLLSLHMLSVNSHGFITTQLSRSRVIYIYLKYCLNSLTENLLTLYYQKEKTWVRYGWFNTLRASNFHPHEAVDRGSETPLLVGEKLNWSTPAVFQCNCDTTLPNILIPQIYSLLVIVIEPLDNPTVPYWLSSSSTASRELLSQFSTCSEWRWLIVGGKWKKMYCYYLKKSTKNVSIWT